MAINVNDIVDSAFKGIVMVGASYFATGLRVLLNPASGALMAVRQLRRKSAEQIHPRVFLFLSLLIALYLPTIGRIFDFGKGAELSEASRTALSNAAIELSKNQSNGGFAYAIGAALIGLTIGQLLASLWGHGFYNLRRRARMHANSFLYIIGTQIVIVSFVVLIVVTLYPTFIYPPLSKYISDAFASKIFEIFGWGGGDGCSINGALNFIRRSIHRNSMPICVAAVLAALVLPALYVVRLGRRADGMLSAKAPVGLALQILLIPASAIAVFAITDISYIGLAYRPAVNPIEIADLCRLRSDVVSVRFMLRNSSGEDRLYKGDSFSLSVGYIGDAAKVPSEAIDDFYFGGLPARPTFSDGRDMMILQADRSTMVSISATLSQDQLAVLHDEAEYSWGCKVKVLDKFALPAIAHDYVTGIIE